MIWWRGVLASVWRLFGVGPRAPIEVFVSYSHQDRDLVRPIADIIRGSGKILFRDVESLTPGKEWRAQVDAALAEARLVIVFWCAHSGLSAEVIREYSSAIEMGKDVMPVRLDDTAVPDDLAAFHWVDFRSLIGDRHPRHDEMNTAGTTAPPHPRPLGYAQSMAERLEGEIRNRVRNPTGR